MGMCVRKREGVREGVRREVGGYVLSVRVRVRKDGVRGREEEGREGGRQQCRLIE